MTKDMCGFSNIGLQTTWFELTFLENIGHFSSTKGGRLFTEPVQTFVQTGYIGVKAGSHLDSNRTFDLAFEDLIASKSDNALKGFQDIVDYAQPSDKDVVSRFMILLNRGPSQLDVQTPMDEWNTLFDSLQANPSRQNTTLLVGNCNCKTY